MSDQPDGRVEPPHGSDGAEQGTPPPSPTPGGAADVQYPSGVPQQPAPVGHQQPAVTAGYQQQWAPGGYAPQPQAHGRGNAMAITGFVIAVVALVLCFIPIINNFAFFLAVVGLVFGIIGLVRTRKGAPRKGLAIAAIVLSVLAGAGVLISQAIYGAMADSVSDSLDDVSADLDKAAGDATDQVLADDLTVEIGEFKATADEFEIVTTELPVTFTNKGSDTASFDITVEAISADGKRIGTDVGMVTDLRAGQSEEVKVFQFVEEDDLEAMETATFEVVEASTY